MASPYHAYATLGRPVTFTHPFGSPAAPTVAPNPVAPKAAAPTAPAPGGAPAAGSYGPPAGFTAQQGSLPPDAGYSQAIGGLQSTRDNTLSGLAGQRTQGLTSAGYIEDPGTGALTFDANNPYSQAALALKSYHQSEARNTNGYAASGQLYSGSLANAQNAAADSYGRANNTILSNLTGFLTNNTTAQNNARSAYATGAGTAYGQMVASAPTNPLYQPFGAGQGGGGTISTDANGNMAITASKGPVALAPQQASSSVKLANGWSIVYGPDGTPVKFIPPGG